MLYIRSLMIVCGICLTGGINSSHGNAEEYLNRPPSVSNKQRHGGMIFPRGYDPYATTNCCNAGDCQMVEHAIRGDKLILTLRSGKTMVFDQAIGE